MARTYKEPCRTAWMAAVAAGLAASAAAQTPKEGDASANSPATSLRYRSALERYQPYKEQAVGSWRDVNDTVGRIGGWRIYAKEAAAQDEGATQGRTADPHTGHPRAKP